MGPFFGVIIKDIKFVFSIFKTIQNLNVRGVGMAQ